MLSVVGRQRRVAGDIDGVQACRILVGIDANGSPPLSPERGVNKPVLLWPKCSIDPSAKTKTQVGDAFELLVLVLVVGPAMTHFGILSIAWSNANWARSATVGFLVVPLCRTVNSLSTP